MWLTELQADGAAFHAAVAEADPNADVPSCPGWTVSHLIHHLGSNYRYVHEHVVRGVTTAPERPLKSILDEPHAADQLTWFDEQLAAVLGTLDALDPETPAWNWAPAAKRAAFWQRRMAHETTIHRWDAQMAIGRVDPIEARLAADGVAEVLDTWVPAGRRAVEGDFAGLVALVATDLEHTWLIRLRGEGIALLDTETIFDDDEHRPTVVAQGPASDLMLALWGRIGFDVLDVSGDEPALDALRVG
jgi:uncharacterized protein (TIGR03083 family)